MNNNKQIFILGAPRSGTTFLASLLEFTDYGKPFETQFITKYYKLLHKFGDLSIKNNLSKLLDKILKERAVQQWKLDLDLDDFYLNLDGNFGFSNIVNNLLLIRNSQFGKQGWGDKTPHYLGDFEKIYDLFPNAKYIYIVRDGRDVALSLLEKEWGPNNIYSCAIYWKRLNKRRGLFNRLEVNGQLLILRYEDLLDYTDEYVRKIYSFLSQNIDESELVEISSTVKAGNYYKWQKKLSNRQIKIFDSVASNTLKRFGYRINYPENGVNFMIEILYKLHNQANYYICLFKINIIDGFKIKFLGKEPFAE